MRPRKLVPILHGTAVAVDVTTDGVHQGEVKLRIGSAWAVVKIDDLLKAVVGSMTLHSIVEQMIGRTVRK